MNTVAARRLYNMATAVLLGAALVASVQVFITSRRLTLAFDDAYMFMRYAGNVRHGFGYAWNPGGAHTYGPTSLLWSLVTLLLSFLPTDVWTQLITGSWLSSIFAVAALAWAVAANARTTWMGSTWRVLPMVVIPLSSASAFVGNQFTGMETMLALGLCALFAGLSLRWSAGAMHPAAVALAAFLMVLTRPESALVAVALPVSLWAFSRERRPALRQLLILLGSFLALLAAELAGCKLYFGTPVPLSVYLKGVAAYPGYGGVWHPELLLVQALASCQVYLLTLLLLARRRDRALLMPWLLSALLICLYLQTVTQIMGFGARYYAPYLGLILVPALLVFDRRMQDGALPTRRGLRLRGAAAALLLLFFLITSSEGANDWIRRKEHHAREAYDPPQLTVAAPHELPRIDWQPMMTSISDQFARELPPGTTMASTEVGYLGAHAPQIQIIDMAGLNDTRIALHGFHARELLARQPDIIWMPHTDYSWHRGTLMSDPGLLRGYDLYAGAANYGLAVRKASPFHEAIQRQLHVFWENNYPGLRMEDYRVTAATWSGQKNIVYGE